MAFSANGKFGFLEVDDVTYNQDTWYNLAQVGSGLAATVELNASCIDAVGGQRIYAGILPNSGTPPTGITSATLEDLEVIEFRTLILQGVPFVRNAILLASQESLYVYADNTDIMFRAYGIIRSEA